MNVSMFSSWEVRCGIADPHAREMHARLNELPDTHIDIVPFDRLPHSRADYLAWGRRLNSADIAHIQFDYSFFDYLLPWRQKYSAMRGEIRNPLVITRHVSFDGPLRLHGTGPGALARRLKWRLYQHPLNPYATFLNKGIFAGADHVIVLTQRLKEQLVRRGLDARKISVIPAGVRTYPSGPANAREELRHRFGWQDKTVIGQFGFIAPPKAHALTLEAVAQLPEKFVYLIAGGIRLESQASMLEALKARITDLGLNHRVHITGYLDETDIPAHVAACDVQVFPYSHADFSQSVADALAFAQCPVIASNIDGHREIKGYCHALRLFAAGDAVGLAAEIQTASEIPDAELQLAQMRAYREAHSWHAIACRTREVYANTLATRN